MEFLFVCFAHWFGFILSFLCQTPCGYLDVRYVFTWSNCEIYTLKKQAEATESNVTREIRRLVKEALVVKRATRIDINILYKIESTLRSAGRRSFQFE